MVTGNLLAVLPSPTDLTHRVGACFYRHSAVMKPYYIEVAEARGGGLERGGGGGGTCLKFWVSLRSRKSSPVLMRQFSLTSSTPARIIAIFLSEIFPAASNARFLPFVGAEQDCQASHNLREPLKAQGQTTEGLGVFIVCNAVSASKIQKKALDALWLHLALARQSSGPGSQTDQTAHSVQP